MSLNRKSKIDPIVYEVVLYLVGFCAFFAQEKYVIAFGLFCIGVMTMLARVLMTLENILDVQMARWTHEVDMESINLRRYKEEKRNV